jgi:hypothetical protein
MTNKTGLILTTIILVSATLYADQQPADKHNCCTEAFENFFDKDTTAIRKRFDLYKQVGVEVIRTFMFTDYEVSRAWYSVVKDYDFRLKVILTSIPGQEAYPGSACIDQNGAVGCISYWYPDLKKIVDANMQIVFKNIETAGVMDKIDYIIPDLGPAGEPLYLATWITGLPDHTFWCYDKYAQEDFRTKMQQKYTDLAAANKLWQTNFASWQDVRVLKPGTRPGRYWNDVLLWYRDSKRDFVRWQIDNTKKYTDKKIVIYVAATHYADTEWEEAVNNADGNYKIKLMSDSEFILDTAAEKNCWLQFTGFNDFIESAYINEYMKKHNYKDVQIWGENAGYFEIAKDPVSLAKIVISNDYWGMDYIFIKYAFEPDRMTPNFVYPKLKQAYNMIRLSKSRLGIDVTPDEPEKIITGQEKISQEYQVKFVNNTGQQTTVNAGFEIPAGWSVTPDKLQVIVPSKKTKQTKFTLTSGLLDNCTYQTKHTFKLNIESDALPDKQASLEKLIIVTPKQSLEKPEQDLDINVTPGSVYQALASGENYEHEYVIKLSNNTDKDTDLKLACDMPQGWSVNPGPELNRHVPAKKIVTVKLNVVSPPMVRFEYQPFNFKLNFESDLLKNKQTFEKYVIISPLNF